VPLTVDVMTGPLKGIPPKPGGEGAGGPTIRSAIGSTKPVVGKPAIGLTPGRVEGGELSGIPSRLQLVILASAAPSVGAWLSFSSRAAYSRNSSLTQG
jgi:hypothetical protein